MAWLWARIKARTTGWEPIREASNVLRTSLRSGFVRWES